VLDPGAVYSTALPPSPRRNLPEIPAPATW